MRTIAVMTGVSSGIGGAAAVALAKRGVVPWPSRLDPSDAAERRGNSN